MFGVLTGWFTFTPPRTSDARLVRRSPAISKNECPHSADCPQEFARRKNDKLLCYARKDRDLRQCFGRTRTFRRCGRRGNWKFFCDDHRLQPIVLVSFLVFTVGAGVASIQSAWFPYLWNRPADNAILHVANEFWLQPGFKPEQELGKKIYKQYAWDGIYEISNLTDAPVSILKARIDWGSAMVNGLKLTLQSALVEGEVLGVDVFDNEQALRSYREEEKQPKRDLQRFPVVIPAHVTHYVTFNFVFWFVNGDRVVISDTEEEAKQHLFDFFGIPPDKEGKFKGYYQCAIKDHVPIELDISDGKAVRTLRYSVLTGVLVVGCYATIEKGLFRIH